MKAWAAQGLDTRPGPPGWLGPRSCCPSRLPAGGDLNEQQVSVLGKTALRWPPLWLPPWDPGDSASEEAVGCRRPAQIPARPCSPRRLQDAASPGGARGGARYIQQDSVFYTGVHSLKEGGVASSPCVGEGERKGKCSHKPSPHGSAGSGPCCPQTPRPAPHVPISRLPLSRVLRGGLGRRCPVPTPPRPPSASSLSLISRARHAGCRRPPRT